MRKRAKNDGGSTWFDAWFIGYIKFRKLVSIYDRDTTSRMKISRNSDRKLRNFEVKDCARLTYFYVFAQVTPLPPGQVVPTQARGHFVLCSLHEVCRCRSLHAWHALYAHATRYGNDISVNSFVNRSWIPSTNAKEDDRSKYQVSAISDWRIPCFE